MTFSSNEGRSTDPNLGRSTDRGLRKAVEQRQLLGWTIRRLFTRETSPSWQLEAPQDPPGSENGLL